MKLYILYIKYMYGVLVRSYLLELYCFKSKARMRASILIGTV